MKTRKLLGLVAMLTFVVVMAIGCKSSDSKKEKKSTKSDIVGTWEMDIEASMGDYADIIGDVDFTYTFNKDGSGTIEAMGATIDVTYEIDDNEITMTVTNEGETETQVGTFTIKDDVLTISVEGEEDAVFKRVK